MDSSEGQRLFGVVPKYLGCRCPSPSFGEKMKTRQGFVSNSSSSSFVIDKKNLTNKQVKLIKSHMLKAEKFGVKLSSRYYTINERDAWEITEQQDEDGNDILVGFTWMDNFPMGEFFEAIGVPNSVVKWEGNSQWVYGEEDED